MSISVSYDPISNSFTIATEQAALTGLSRSEYGMFVDDVHRGRCSPVTLMRAATAPVARDVPPHRTSTDR